MEGDYLLDRLSIFLGILRDVELVEITSSVIEHLVRGEVMHELIPLLMVEDFRY